MVLAHGLRRAAARPRDARCRGFGFDPGAPVGRFDTSHNPYVNSGYAVSPLLGGIAHVAVNFAAWSASTGLTETWAANSSAVEVAVAVDKLVSGTDAVALHIEGVSGMGKTRAVLEALRGKSCEPLVAYVHAADALPPNLVYQPHRQGRHAILVIDECDARTHEVLAHQIPVGSKARLITIGTPSGYRPKAEAHKIGSVEDQAMREVLRLNQPALPPETAWFVVGAAAGNVKLALLLANDIVRRPASTPSALITPEIIESYVTGALPSGTGLLACAALALFTSIGFDFDLGGELKVAVPHLVSACSTLRPLLRTLTVTGCSADRAVSAQSPLTRSPSTSQREGGSSSVARS